MHPIENIMQTAMAEIKEMVDVNTIVGDPVTAADGSTIIPISKVSFGFLSGGGEYGQSTEENSFPFAGGASSGVSITPVGFLVADEKNIQLMSIHGRNPVDHLIHSLPQLINEIKEACTCMQEKE